MTKDQNPRWDSGFFIFRQSSKLFLPEHQKPLPEIIKCHKQAHPRKHRRIIPNRPGISGKYIMYARLCDPISQNIAYGYINHKPHCLANRFFPALKRKILVQEKAYDAPDNIIHRRGGPIPHVKYIVAHKHHACPNQRIDNPHN